jgi:hypothetical protein
VEVDHEWAGELGGQALFLGVTLLQLSTPLTETPGADGCEQAASDALLVERSREEIDLVSVRIEKARVALTPERVPRSLLALEARTRDRCVDLVDLLG